jgi:hypothetical protein
MAPSSGWVVAPVSSMTSGGEEERREGEEWIIREERDKEKGRVVDL